MLDLNVEIIATDSSPTYNDNSKSLMIMEEDVGPKLLEEDDDDEEEDAEQSSAGTSNSSSVVNADDPPPNAGDENTSSPLIFGIIKKEGGTLSPDLVTRQLFPAVGEGSELGFGAQSLTSKPQWLNLSFGGGDSGGAPAAGGVPELRILQQKQQQQQVRKSRRGPRSRSSQYRGVTFYRRTGRWESHIWDCGKQVYLGGFDTAYAAARAYDRAAIKFRGVDADINFNIGDYDEDMKQMGNLTKEEFVHILRRQSTGFSRGSSKFRGVSLHKCGPWDARVGQFLGKKPHDKAAVPYNGREAMTNFKPGTYEGEIILDVGSGGRAGHNLDLNLGISLPSSGSKEARSGGEVHLYYADGEMPSREVTMGDCSFPAPKRPPIWSAMYPFLLPNSEGKATEKRAAEGNPKSGWKMQFGNSGGIDGSAPLLMPVVFPHAASSGFSASLSSSSTTPAPHLQRNAVLHGPTNPSLHAIAKPASSSSFPYLSFRN